MGQGTKLRDLAAKRRASPVMGTVNAYTAILAERSGVPAIYISGGATAACLGLPDLGVVNLDDVARLSAQICAATDLPLLVDVDTGFGGEAAIGRTVDAVERSGAAGLHIEDQTGNKRCGHRPGKELCPAEEMVDRIKACCDARDDSSFVVMARTDAIGVSGEDEAQDRALAYVEAGADMVFLEGITEVGQLKRLAGMTEAPVLANMTEFGVSPLLGRDELAENGVALTLYPLTAFRVMARSAEKTYKAVVDEGSQVPVLDRMQDREELYERLGYHRFERTQDRAIGKGK